MSKPNRNGILYCADCGEMVHIKHATDSRCPECHDSYVKENCEPEVDEEAAERVEHWDREYAKFAPDSTERTK